jgi:hypothetical protein
MRKKAMKESEEALKQIDRFGTGYGGWNERIEW